MKQSVITAIDRALIICGGATRLAQIIGISQGAISNWKSRGSRIPAEYCPIIERATSGEVKRQDLRPDDWNLIWPELATPASLTPALAGSQRETSNG